MITRIFDKLSAHIKLLPFELNAQIGDQLMIRGESFFVHNRTYYLGTSEEDVELFITVDKELPE